MALIHANIQAKDHEFPFSTMTVPRQPSSQPPLPSWEKLASVTALEYCFSLLELNSVSFLPLLCIVFSSSLARSLGLSLPITEAHWGRLRALLQEPTTFYRPVYNWNKTSIPQNKVAKFKCWKPQVLLWQYVTKKISWSFWSDRPFYFWRIKKKIIKKHWPSPWQWGRGGFIITTTTCSNHRQNFTSPLQPRATNPALRAGHLRDCPGTNKQCCPPGQQITGA